MITLVKPFIGDYPVTQTFQEHVDQHKAGYNGGIDWGMPTGTAIYAAAPGKIVKAGPDASGYGEHVRIDHGGGYMTIYAHLEMAVVSAGQEVQAGQMIARSDNTGNSTGPHLHFELRQNGQAIDPAPYFLAVEQPTPPPAQAWPTFPTLPRARVVSLVGLRVRQGPGREFLQTGFLDYGATPEIIRQRPDDKGNPWVQIGFEAWCAWQYDNEQLMEWL